MTADLAARRIPPRFLTDANVNRRIVTGLRRRLPEMDLATAWELDMHALADPTLLREAMALDRILVTHDVHTITAYFHAFAAGLPVGEQSPGVLLIAQDVPIGVAIEELEAIWACTSHEEWRQRLTFLPL